MSTYIPSIVFIAGVHGVGKTTFSKKISEALGIPTYSAGHLIKSHKSQTTSYQKMVADVSGNQDLLVEAVRSLQVSRRTIILDGHFCVRDTTGTIQQIPLATYEALNLKLAIIIHDDASVIQARLHSRDGGDEFCEDINLLQDSEIKHGNAIATIMRIPFRLLQSSQIDEAIRFIRAEIEVDGEPGKPC